MAPGDNLEDILTFKNLIHCNSTVSGKPNLSLIEDYSSPHNTLSSNSMTLEVTFLSVFTPIADQFPKEDDSEISMQKFLVGILLGSHVGE